MKAISLAPRLVIIILDKNECAPFVVIITKWMESFANDDDAMGDGTGAHYDELLFEMFDKTRTAYSIHMYIEHYVCMLGCVTPIGNTTALGLIK